MADFVDTRKLKRDEMKDFLPDFYTNKTHWYALHIQGDAMTAQLGHSKSFHEGDIIIVDPDKQTEHGSFVIALLPRLKQATFK